MTDRFRNAEIVKLAEGRAAVTCTLTELDQMLADLRAAGTPVSTTDPVPTGVPGQVLVTLTLMSRQHQYPAPRQRQQPAARPAARPVPARRRLPRWAVTAAVAGAAAVALAAGWLVWTLTRWIADNAALVVGMLVCAALAVFLASRIGGGGGATFSGTFQGRMD